MKRAPFQTGFTAYVTNGGWNMMESILSILILENSTRTYLLEYDDEEKPDPHYGHELNVKKDDAGSQTRVFYELNELREDRKVSFKRSKRQRKWPLNGKGHMKIRCMPHLCLL
jgi:hypothetical protein